MKRVFLSSDWETANIEDVKIHISIIKAMDRQGIIISSRLGTCKQTLEYLNKRCKKC